MANHNMHRIPIAIVGMSGRYPGDAANPEKLWDMIAAGRSARSEVPSDRFNVDAFYHPHNERGGTLNSRGGHFVQHMPIDAFDAPFFSITPNEAKAMDPQQRWALECTYEAIENAGLRMEKLAGSDTSVYVGTFTKDYGELLSADNEDLPLYYGTGTGTAIVSNRISWFYDFKGPSVSLDTGCSSSLVALHMGCQSLRTGESSVSVVGGVNFILLPGMMTAMASLHFLSPDDKCHSFDAAGNGYARGEGASFLVLKPLDKALKDGDVVRGVIRNTALNQDGNTPGITVPSAASQEALIRRCYAEAGLSLSDTQYVEAHGTGTEVGDPQETAALGATIGKSRKHGDPLLIGSIKTNIGHLEGASGLVQVQKAVFSLEKGLLAPNLWFENPNPRIHFDKWNLKVVENLTAFPDHECPRRVSINSFGYGGTNAHCIIDNAYDYFRTHGLKGKHNVSLSSSSASTPASTDSGFESSSVDDMLSLLETTGSSLDFFSSKSLTQTPKLAVWSSNEQSGIERTAQMYSDYLQDKIERFGEDQIFDKFIRTLSSRRSIFPWRSFAISSNAKELCSSMMDPPLKPKRAGRSSKIGFIFTGQGAQWHAMGRELCVYPVYQNSLQDASTFLVSLGANWSLIREFFKDEKSSRVSSPAFSQPMCTALQVALVDLLNSWGINPLAVVGHSSGEIAAAYAAGAITQQDAWTISYHRGRLSGNIKGLAPHLDGSMMAVGLSVEDVQPYLEKVDGQAVVACKNSPTSITISGDTSALKQLGKLLEVDGVFARLLKVETAYHSPHMAMVADLYKQAIAHIKPISNTGKDVKMFSSVSGKIVQPADLGPSYWVSNMVSPVEFVEATQSLVRFSPGSTRAKKPFVDLLVELGPHGALQGPTKQILKGEDKKISEVEVLSVLGRGKDATVSALELAGRLFQQGVYLELEKVNNDLQVPVKDTFLVDIPPFAWNRANKYWCESGHSKEYRFRKHPRTDLLGTVLNGSHELEPLYRNILRQNEIPWLENHKVQGTILYPAAGMLVMAIEGAARHVDPTRELIGYEIKDAIIGKAIVIPSDDSGKHTMLSMRPWRQSTKDLITGWTEFRVFSRSDEGWEVNCTGLIRPAYETQPNPLFTDENNLADRARHTRFKEIEVACQKKVHVESHYSNLQTIGLNFSGAFKSLTSIMRGDYMSRCSITVPDTKAMMPYQIEYSHVIHPSTLDAIIQTGLAASTPVEEELTVALIPTAIDRLFVSTKISSTPGAILQANTEVIRAGAQSNAKGNITVFEDASESPVLLFEGLQCTALRHGELGFAQAASIRKLAAYFHWQEDITRLESSDLAQICSAKLQDADTIDSTIISELELASFIYMKRVLKTIHPDEAKSFLPHFTKFYSFMQKINHQVQDDLNPHQNLGLNWLDLDLASEEAILTRVSENSPDGAALCAHGRSLVPIMRGEQLAIEVLSQNNYLNNFYQFGVGCEQTYLQLARYMDLLAHKKPDMKILEIGAGTGGATLPILNVLSRNDSATPRFSSYTFTDISTGFFEKAYEKFKTWLPFMNFAKLNIEDDPVAQGLRLGDYDVVIAANVLHATKSMAKTLSNVRSLMKPDSKLVMVEVTNPLLRVHMIVGSFDGWWAGGEDGREWGPTMTKDRWDVVLKQNSFSGVDLALQDINNARDQMYSLLVSTSSPTPPEPLPENVVLVNPLRCTETLQSFSSQVVKRLQSVGVPVEVTSLEEASDLDPAGKAFIFTLDANGGSFLPDISSDNWLSIQKIIMAASSTTWLTAGATLDCKDPSTSLMTGMARCIRAENPSVALTTLDFDSDAKFDSARTIDLFMDLFGSAADAINASKPDWELAIRDDRVLVPRILLETGMNDWLSSFWVEPKTEQLTFKQEERALMLRAATPGRLDSLRFEDDHDHEKALREDEVEIEVKAVGLNFKDVMIAMGQITDLPLGLDCSGIITRVGSAVPAGQVKIGDRVATWTLFGSLRTYTRTHLSMCVVIPDELSYGVAASLPVVYSTAYYSLYEVARLQKGESILIHGAAGGLGQAAIQLAQHIGAVVFATVSSTEKKALMREKFHIPEDNIFSSRDDGFKSGVMRMTKGKGVNVILNSLAGEYLQDSWHCMAPFGRFIELGQKDLESNTGLDMAPFLKNISFHSVNMMIVQQYAMEQSATVFHGVMELFKQKTIRAIEPTTIMPFSEIETGFRLMQMGHHIGKIVFENSDDQVVPMVPASIKSIRFDPTATYLITGGLGGLGRSISTWMVSLGAKNIAFFSRSGDAKEEAKETIRELQRAGARVVPYKCDISDATQVKTTLARVSTELPPLRGVIQAAMVLKDSLYTNMSSEQFNGAIQPKLHGSWNLHTLIPNSASLDFFVMLASSAGIAGSRGQSNYAAGNAYQDALAYHRRAKGMRATAIDLGVVLDVGSIAETLADGSNKDIADNVNRWKYTGLWEKEVLAMMQAAITQETIKGMKLAPQLVSGLGTGGMANLAGIQIPWWFMDAKFAHLKIVDTQQIAAETEEDTQAFQTLFAQATTMDTAVDVVTVALVRKLAKSLMVDVEDIEASKPTSRYGVDSLLAVEIRSWIFTDVQADVSVFQLLSNIPISELSKQIALKSKLLPAGLNQEDV